MPSTAADFRALLADRWVPLAVIATAFGALILRLYALGHRVFYYDEAWVGYWVLKFLEHGSWQYRPVLHGPFFIRVNSVVFSVFGATEFTARLVVAVIGGLLPLSAWLFRDRLRNEEIVSLAFILAINPLLLYYSRFMRNDLPLAAFMLVALGLLVRAYDTRSPRYLYGMIVALGIAFTTKESVLLWLLTWGGAALLVFDRRLLRVREEGSKPVSFVRSRTVSAMAGFRMWATHLMGASILFFLIIIFFYAPRSTEVGAPGLWKAVGGKFEMFPAVIERATLGSYQKAIGHWAGGTIQSHPYLPYLLDTLWTLAMGAMGVCLLAIVGFLHDRYAGSTRDLVEFSFYCGVAATLGYPLANSVPVPWSTVHAVVALSIPAAVGVGVVYRWGRSQLPSQGTARSDRTTIASERTRAMIRAGGATVLLVALVVSSGFTAVETSYLNPYDSPRNGGDGNEVVYYAQAPEELQTVITAIDHAAATGGNDTDVLYVGRSLVLNESSLTAPPATAAWFRRIPLPWYTETIGADVTSVAVADDIGSEPPPVVITTVANRSAVAQKLGQSYTAKRYRLDEIGDRTLVVFFRNTNDS